MSYLAIGNIWGALVGFAIATIVNFAAWFSSHQLVLAAYKARPLNETEKSQIEPIVQKLCDRAILPLPSLYIIPTHVANI